MNISLLYYLSNSAGGGSWDYSGIDIDNVIITILSQKRSFVSSAHISEAFLLFLRFVLLFAQNRFSVGLVSFLPIGMGCSRSAT